MGSQSATPAADRARGRPRVTSSSVPARPARRRRTTTVAGASPPTTVATVAGPAVGGRLVDRDGEPVEGAELEARQGDEVIDRATTNENGEWQIAVPEPDTSYSVTLDVDTLPEGVGLRDPDRDTLDDVRVRSGLKVVLFPLGEPTGSSPSAWESILDLTAEGVRFGLVLAVASLGLSLVFAVTGLTNFAHGELVTFGALRRVLLQCLGVPVPAPGRRASRSHRGRRVRRGERARAVSPAAQAAVRNGVAHRRDDRTRRCSFGTSTWCCSRAGRGPFREYTIQKDYELGPISLRPKDFVDHGDLS